VSAITRARTKKECGKCPFCGGEIECCFHFVTRSKHSVRWDLDNVIGSCKGCNFKNEFDPDNYRAWLIGRIGGTAYINLVKKSNVIVKRSIADLEDMLKNLEQIKKMEEICG